MPEIRQNLATKEWVIIATERAKRPEDFKKALKIVSEKPAFSPDCPFCPGNEAMTPPAVLESKDEKGNWQVRVTPNKFPALIPKGEACRTIAGISRVIEGYGYHEVIQETPRHNLTTALLPLEQIETIIKVYHQRLLILEKDPCVRLVVIFKNHGESAGTSLEHPHSQMVAMPMVPSQARQRVEDAMRYYDDTGECVYCTMLNEELKQKLRVVLETEHFVTFVPFAALSPFHLWIMPKTHQSCFCQIKPDQIKDLALVLKTVLGKIYYGLGDPDFNYMIRVAPWDFHTAPYLHWYITVVLRLTKSAGFELGSGMHINISLPEDNARYLREVIIPEV